MNRLDNIRKAKSTRKTVKLEMNPVKGMRKAVKLIECAAAFAVFLFLTGCSSQTENDMRNVEQRDYATILLTADGTAGKRYEFALGIAQEKKVGDKSQTEKVSTFSVNTLDELKKEYQEVKGKELSLSHLKVILLAEEDAASLEAQWDILNELDKDREIAKTCPVLQISDKEEFLAYLEDAKEPVGTYISDLVKIMEGEGKQIPWLKDYLKALREGTEVEIYDMEPAPEGWQLSQTK